MNSFKTRLHKISKQNGRLILANDYDVFSPSPSPSTSYAKTLESKTLKNIKTLCNHICAIKLNFHLLLPLDLKQIININKTAHKYNLQTIADIKLNDIGNTNNVAAMTLWNMGFDAIIVNPIMGIQSLQNLIKSSHKQGKGVITLCHMSAPEAKLTYEMTIKYPHTTSSTDKDTSYSKKNTKQTLYNLFLDWAISQKADGVIVGATFPDIIKSCKSKSNNSLDIFSPGVGTQGGKISDAISAGSDYLIMGRSILHSDNPINTAKEIQSQCMIS
jgi:orotidine-5'-phosphate decarboxylase